MYAWLRGSLGGLVLLAAALGSVPRTDAAVPLHRFWVTGHIVPTDTVKNPNCGEAAMYLVDNGSQTMIVQYEWYSDIGNIAYVRASGSWQAANGRKGTLAAPNPVAPGNRDTADRIQGPVMTGRGRVHGTIPVNSMSFTTVDGLVCLFPALQSTTTIF